MARRAGWTRRARLPRRDPRPVDPDTAAAVVVEPRKVAPHAVDNPVRPGSQADRTPGRARIGSSRSARSSSRSGPGGRPRRRSVRPRRGPSCMPPRTATSTPSIPRRTGRVRSSSARRPTAVRWSPRTGRRSCSVVATRRSALTTVVANADGSNARTLLSDRRCASSDGLVAGQRRDWRSSASSRASTGCGSSASTAQPDPVAMKETSLIPTIIEDPQWRPNGRELVLHGGPAGLDPSARPVPYPGGRHRPPHHRRTQGASPDATDPIAGREPDRLRHRGVRSRRDPRRRGRHRRRSPDRLRRVVDGRRATLVSRWHEACLRAVRWWHLSN